MEDLGGVAQQEPVKKDENRITFKAVAEEDLKPDLSNLDSISSNMLAQALQGRQREIILQRVNDALLLVAAQGTGVIVESLPQALRQLELECQTMALLNGIQAWEGRARVANLIPQIPEIRSMAMAKRAGDPTGEYSMTAVDEVLTEMGFLKTIRTPANPIQLARQLFTDHRFLGVANTDAFHAYTVLPLQRSDNPQAFALRLDSLDGRTDTLSSNDFLKIVLAKQENENQQIYQVAKPKINQSSHFTFRPVPVK